MAEIKNRVWLSLYILISAVIFSTSARKYDFFRDFQDVKRLFRPPTFDFAARRQSPIDIKQRLVRRGHYCPCLEWNGYDETLPGLVFKQKEDTVQATAQWSPLGPPTLWGGALPGPYSLEQIHWHWGDENHRGSEHAIDGKKYPLEMHLVHFNAYRYRNVSEASQAWRDREALLVVGVFFQLVEENANPGIAEIAENLAEFNLLGSTPDGLHLPLALLDLAEGGGYYTYLGSLTSPPYLEVVRWIVADRVLNITLSQLNVFRDVKLDGEPIRSNWRRIQPHNKRQIFYHHC